MRSDVIMPRSRVDQLAVQQLADETLVYDLDRHKAHCLNKTAAAVWSRCDGRTDVAEMARVLHEDLGLPHDEAIVWLALGQLKTAKLLEGPVAAPATASSAGRRAALKRIGLVGGAAALLPAISSILSPTAVSAATCGKSGTGCATGAQCCSGVCQPGNTCL